MSGCRNFRITLHLSHFFQDHRSVCRIFINKKMKHIIDLENHLQKIFGLKEFYLMAHGHYIPPSEDIRILQQDDIIVAIPTTSNNAIMYTSTPLAKHINSESIKTKRKRKTVEEGEKNIEIPNLNSQDWKSTPTKKRKKKHAEDILQVGENKILGTEENEENLRDYEFQENIKQNNIKPIKNKKGLKQKDNISDINESNSSVKEKVLYFEKQSNLDDSQECIENKLLKEDKVISKKLEDEKQDYKKKPINMSHIETLELQEGKENNLDQFRHTKLFVQKRNTDIISFDLPKKLNIVKSILISNELLSSPNKASESSSINTVNNACLNNTQNCAENGMKEKSNTLIGNSKKSMQNNEIQLEDLEQNSFKFENNPVQLTHAESEEMKINDSSATNTEVKGTQIIEDAQEIKVRTCLSETIHSHDSHSIKNVKTIEDRQYTNLNEKCIVNGSTAIENAELTVKDHAAGTNTECKSEPDPEQYIYNKDTEGPNKHIKNDSILSVQSTMDICSQKELTVLNDSTFSDGIKSGDTESFVTKRKRKRSHRKRKSKLNAIDNSMSPKTEFQHHTPYIPSTNIVHIKFDDDGDPIRIGNAAEKNGKKPSLEAFEEIVDSIINVSSETKQYDTPLNSKMQFQEGKALVQSSNDLITINDTTDDISNRLSTYTTTLLSEDTILKSPIMTATKPKVGDLIAFKVLRLAEDYTPELSKYIVGEILSFTDSTSNVDIRIIDGLSQCREPDGKFSFEKEQKQLNNIKSYCWANLIEPRLIFP